MLNEPASDSENRPDPEKRPELHSPEHDPAAPLDATVTDPIPDLTPLRDIVCSVLSIDTQTRANPDDSLPPDLRMVGPEARLIVTYAGRLHVESAAAYALLDDSLAPRDLVPVFRTDADGRHLVHILAGRITPQPRAWWPNLILLLLTFGTMLYAGTIQALGEIGFEDPLAAAAIADDLLPNLWRGLPYALSILLILGAHELGHYFAARRHRLSVTLPYFIPSPIPFFGTFGAFIQLRQPMRSRRVLLQVGAAGPLAGMLFAVPVLMLGLATSPTGPIMPGGLLEGGSLLYSAAKFLSFGQLLPNGQIDVYLNQLAWAGWTGLFVTGLNLIPLGQLDGGHVLYALIGRRARTFYWPLLGAMGVLVMLTGGALLLILVLLALLGRVYAVPLDDITPLTGAERGWAVFTLIVFMLVFVPVPLSEVTAVGGPLSLGDQAALVTLPALMVALWRKS